MSKNSTTDKLDEPKVLQPSLAIATSNHKDLQHPVFNVAAKNNEYILAELDKEGNEVVGSEFTVSETTFRTSFANNVNFKVKKNPR